MTSFLDRLLGRPGPPDRPYAKAVTSLGPWANGIPLSSWMGGTEQDRARAYLAAYKVGWFYKAGRKIADDVASLDWSVSDGDAEEGEDETTLDRPDLQTPFDSLDPIEQFMRLIERPNPSYTGRQLIRKTQVRLDFAGAAAWYLEGGATGLGLPSAIYGISPARMWPSYDKAGNLIGWVMDRDNPSGGVPFDKREILWFSVGNAADDEIWGTSVVEAVYSQVPLTDLMARHTGNVLTTGGRLAGMMWPKERALSEDEFLDAQRAWRNVASDPDAGKRLLIFPEPMEYAAGASTPAEIGIPELAALNRDEILTAFPISPYRLGVPMPGGLNSAELRKEDRRDYFEGTIHPRADLIEEAVQVNLLARYENVMGRTFDFEIAEPNLDDAPGLLEKVAALRALAAAGFDEKESVQSVGLAHIKFTGIPVLPDPAITVTANDTTPHDTTQTQSEVIAKPKPAPAAPVAKAVKAREDVATKAAPDLATFLAEQRDRTVAAIRANYPAAKALKEVRVAWATKADPEWWDVTAENAALRSVMARVYLEAGKTSLQVVADSLDRIVPGKSLDRIVADLLSYGGERIADINARTLQAITIELATGTKRGYTMGQLIDGVPHEGFKGVLNVGLDNGTAVWGDLRAETIARTETALSYNRAALSGYRDFNVREVVALDGDKDDECASRNGQTYSVDDAFGVADHPNGTLDWAPVVGKAYQGPDPTILAVLETMKALIERPAPPASDVHITNAPPAITVEPAQVNITNTPPEINLPNVFVEPATVKVEPAQVHITNQPPDITVNPPNIYMEPAQVTVEPAQVTVEASKVQVDVHVPETAAPTVTVEQPAIQVDVHVPEPKPTTKRVIRDKSGQISSIEER